MNYKLYIVFVNGVYLVVAVTIEHVPKAKSKYLARRDNIDLRSAQQCSFCSLLPHEHAFCIEG